MENQKTTTRRNFLKTAGTAAVGLNLVLPNTSFGYNDSKTLKVGLVGCGGRGTGAAHQALSADENVVLSAMADVFSDRLEESKGYLEELHPGKIQIAEDHHFVGFDAYQKLIDSDVDVVILTTPPAFRPAHLEYAIDKKKHVFCEKPMAVDAQGVRRVLAVAKKAKEQGTSLMSGFCWRYHMPKRASFGKVHDGAIGDIQTIYNTYNTEYLWEKPRQEGWSDMEYKMRNWIYYNWLSGDHIMEQAVHSLDMMVWAMGDKLPVRAMGTGGRQRRIEEKYGNVFDHFV